MNQRKGLYALSPLGRDQVSQKRFHATDIGREEFADMQDAHGSLDRCSSVEIHELNKCWQL